MFFRVPVSCASLPFEQMSYVRIGACRSTKPMMREGIYYKLRPYLCLKKLQRYERKYLLEVKFF